MRALRGVGAPLIKFAILRGDHPVCTALLAGTISNQSAGPLRTTSAKFTDRPGVRGSGSPVCGSGGAERSLVDRRWRWWTSP